MARSIISDETWERAKEYFEHGLSLSMIEDKTGISRGSISRKSKKEQWSKETPKKQLLNDAVGVSVAKATMSETQKEVFEELHNEIVNPKIFFGGVALRNQILANKVLDEIESNGAKKDDINALEAHSRITQRNKETVLGKDKTTEINNTNAQQTNLTIEEISTHVGEMLPD